MADKKFITKNGLQTQNIDFVSPNNSNTIQAQMLDSDTLSFTGQSGQLFSVTDSLSGTIFAVNDVSGIPSIEVKDDGTILFAQYSGNIGVGKASSIAKLDIADTVLSGSGSLAGSILNLAQTWNTTGTPTAVKLNVTDTASNAASLLFDLQVGGTSRFKVEKSGEVTATSSLWLYGTGGSDVNRSGIAQWSTGSRVGNVIGGVFRLMVTNSGFTFLRSDDAFGWSPDANLQSNSPDVRLFRDAAATLALRNGLNAQTFRVYNTYTGPSDYELGKIAWELDSAVPVLRIGTEKAGSGVARALQFQTDGTTRFSIATNGTATFSTVVSLNSQVILYQNGSGILTLSNGGNNAFDRIQIGGTTSSFPALKRNTTFLEAKLADDSGYTGFRASGIELSGNRPINLYTDSGKIQFKGSSGGYVIGAQFLGSANTSLGWMGINGTDDTLNYFLIGSNSASPALSVLSNNNVGIGNTAPTQPLHVTGNIRVTGAYYDSTNSAGTSNQVLTSTGTGTDWKSLSELTGVDGTGTANYVAKWSDTDTITNSQIFDSTNVGIGTTNQSEKLTIAGNLSVGFANENVTRSIIIHSSSPFNEAGIIRQDGASLNFLYSVANQSLNLGISGTRWALGINYYGGSHKFYRTSGANPIVTIDDTTSYVGINTTSPSGQLHAASDGTLTTNLLLGQVINTSDNNRVGYSISTGNGGNIYIDAKTYTAGKIIHRAGRGTEVAAAIPWMTYDPSTIGVGFGTTSPVAGLHLSSNAGQIRAEGTGSDYCSGSILLYNSSTNVPTSRGNGMYMYMLNSGGTANEWFIGRPYSSNDKIIFARKVSPTGAGQDTAQDVHSLMTLDSSGNLGVGTNSPNGKLELFGSQPVLVIKDSLTGINSNDYLLGSLAFHGSDTSANCSGVYASIDGLVYDTNNDVQGSAGEGGALAFNTYRHDTGGAARVKYERMRITTDGNVGIGVTAPDQKLHIGGANTTAIRFSTLSEPSYYRSEIYNYYNSLKTFEIVTVGGSVFRSSESGYASVQVGNTTYYENSSQFGYHRFMNGAAEQGRFTNTGLGIGTTAPTAKLELRGDKDGTSNFDAMQLVISGNTDSNKGVTFGLDTTNNHAVIYARTLGVGGLPIRINGSSLYIGAGTNSSVGVGSTAPPYKLYSQIDNNTPGNTTTALGIRNINAGSAADTRFYLGNDISGSAGAILTYSSNHTSTPNALSIINNVSGATSILTFHTNASTERMRIDGSGRVGVATISPVTRFQVGAKVSDDNNYSYDSNSLMVVHQTATSTTVLNDPQEVLFLTRQGTGSQAYGAAASFRLSRYENAGNSNVGSRTRLDIVLAHNVFMASPTTVLTALSSGNIGIGTTTPTARLQTHATDASNIPLLVRGAGGQTADMQQWQDSSGLVRTVVTAGGNVGIRTATPKAALHTATGFYALISQSFFGGSHYSNSNGLLIRTDVAVSDNRMIELTIEGNSYNDTKGPIFARVQCYNYTTSGTIINTSAFSTDPGFSIDVFHYEGFVYFWFAQTSSFQTYTFKLISPMAEHVITQVSNVVKPTTGVTNSVTITPAKLWNSFNDGAGSGLDADLLDGQQGSYYAAAASISGTTNYIAKFTSSSAIGNSIIFDNGTNVGIGTASPGSKLTIDGGEIAVTSTSANPTLTLTDTSANNDPYIRFIPATSSNAFALGIDDSDSDKFKISYGSSAVLGVSDRFTIDTSGNVGIGTASPTYKLHVIGSFAATTKSFVIDHPTKPNQILRHGSLEGPEFGVYVRGKSTKNVIQLPDYWFGLVDEDTITVNITAVGKIRSYAVERIENNNVYIYTDSQDNEYNYCYIIFAERKDINKLVVEE